MHKWVSNAEFKRGAKDSSSGMGSWMLFWFKVFTRGRGGGGGGGDNFLFYRVIWRIDTERELIC